VSFLDMAQDLMQDAEAKAAFDADPDGFLGARGFDGLSPDDLSEAVGFVAETLPADAAVTLSDANGPADGLARLAELSPDDPESILVDAESPELLEQDPSGELDLPDGQEDAMAAEHRHGDEPADVDPVAAGLGEPSQLGEEGGHGLERLGEPEPGFGVGYEPGDADDVTAASPEFADVLEHPADVDLDVTHVPDLAFAAADPINEAITWADHDEAATDPVEHTRTMGPTTTTPTTTGTSISDP
jgi:hypothetical protein